MLVSHCSRRSSIFFNDLSLFVDGDEFVDFIALSGFDSEDAFHGVELENDTIGVHFHRLNVLIRHCLYQVFLLYSE